MGSHADADAIRRLLAPIADAFDADGYVLTSRIDGDRLVVRIDASAGVCDDCLVPKSAMMMMLKTALSAGGVAPDLAIDLIYPTEHGMEPPPSSAFHP